MANGDSSLEGRVEIYHNGEWGTVCDDGWDLQDATVVCRQLGFASAMSATATFGEGSGPIWLDEVSCSRSDLRLLDCNHRGWNVHNCGHSEDAGIICEESSETGDGTVYWNFYSTTTLLTEIYFNDLSDISDLFFISNIFQFRSVL